MRLSSKPASSVLIYRLLNKENEVKALKRLERHSSRRYKVIARRLRKQGFTTEGLMNSLHLVKFADRNKSFDEIVEEQKKNWDKIPPLHRKHAVDFRKLVIA